MVTPHTDNGSALGAGYAPKRYTEAERIRIEAAIAAIIPPGRDTSFIHEDKT